MQLEVWACPPGFLGICFWQRVGVTMTDDNGNFNFVGTSITAPRTTWGVRVLSMNNAAMADDGRWYDLPAPRITSAPLLPQDRTLDFSHLITNQEWLDRFTILGNLQVASRRIAVNRDPRETDALPRVTVHFGSVDGYDPIAGRLNVRLVSAGKIIYGYAEFIQHQLGWLAAGTISPSDQCGQNSGGSRELAWRSGFAYELAVATFRDAGAEYAFDGIPFPSDLDSNSACDGSGVDARGRPLTVAAILNDLRDADREAGDPLDGYFNTVVQIMDNELDHLGRPPTIDDFYRATVQRGIPRAKLNTVFRTNQVEPPARIPGYDDDERADFAVFTPSTGTWFFINSATYGMESVQFGNNGDLPVPGDYDGDQLTDLAVFRPSDGTWYVRSSAQGGAVNSVQWGAADDIPVPGDYDGDGKFDRAIYRPSNGYWWVIQSRTGQVTYRQWGAPGDRPVPGDYDGDLRTDYAVWRPAFAIWFVIPSGSGGTTWTGTPFGVGGANGTPVPGDYDGDRRTDFGYFHPLNAAWWMQDRALGAGDLFSTFTAPLDVLAPADFDGDGRDDVAYWRPSTGMWTVEGSLWNRWPTPLTQRWGQAGDIPVARR